VRACCFVVEEEEGERPHDELSVVEESSSASCFIGRGSGAVPPACVLATNGASVHACLLAIATCKAKDDGWCDV
jgi:hypothetical protein